MRFLFRVLVELFLYIGLLILLVEFFGGPAVTFILQRYYGLNARVGRVSLLSGLRVMDLSYEGDSARVELGEIKIVPFFRRIGARSLSVSKGRISLKMDEKANGDVAFNPIALVLIPVNLPVERFLLDNLRIELEKGGAEAVLEVDQFSFYKPDLERGYYDFRGRARLFDGSTYGELETNGWLDWDKKNALFVLKGEHIPLGSLRPFLDVPGIEGLLSFRVEGEAENNVLVLKNWFSVEGLEVSGGSALVGIPLVSAVLGPLTGLGEEKVEVRFKVTTRLDNPQIDLKKEILSALMKEKGEEESGDESKAKVSGDIYDIINDLVGIVGSVLGD